jgi:urease accessory protein
VRAVVHLAIGWDGRRAFAADVRAEAPFSIRHAAGRFLFVSTAAAPVRGDELEVTIDVAAGAVAEVGSVASMIVWPGPDGAPHGPPSRLTTRITVGVGAHLVWAPEPTVSVVGSDHVARTSIELAERASCSIVEEYSLGRHGEPCGALLTELRVTRGGRALVHHAERFGPGSSHHVVAAVTVGAPCTPFVRVDNDLGVYAARLPGADPDVSLVLAAAPDRPTAVHAAGRAGSEAGHTAMAARTWSRESSPPAPAPVMRPDSST